MVVPSPVPPKRRLIEASAWANGSKDALQTIRGNADTAVTHGKVQFITLPGGPHLQTHPALFGELHRVAQQGWSRHLLDTQRIAFEVLTELGRVVQVQVKPLASALRRRELRVLAQLGQRKVRTLQFNRASLSLAVSRMPLSSPSNERAACTYGAEVTTLLAVQGAVEEHFGKPDEVAFIGVQISWLTIGQEGGLGRRCLFPA